MAFGKAIGSGENTPTAVRGTGTTERLSSHRATDTGPSDGAPDFERSIVNRPNYRGQRKRSRTRR